MVVFHQLFMSFKLILEIPFGLFSYFVSFFIPKSNNIWVFGGWFGERFGDNPRYLYQYVHNKKNDLNIDRVIWITRNEKVYNTLSQGGYEVYLAWSLKSIWYHLRSNQFIIDQSLKDVNNYFIHNANVLHLWHGFPFKKIGTYANSEERSIKFQYYSKIIRALEALLPGLTIAFGSNNCYLLAHSPFSAEILGNAFEIPRDRILISGYPRNDILTSEYPFEYYLDDDIDVIQTISKIKDEGKKILFYAPTFRDRMATHFLGLTKVPDIQRFEQYLFNNGYILVTKFHSADKSSNSISKNKTSIINLDSDSDIYPILPLVDILITDYSSIAFDFFYLDKPVIYFPYDLDYYRDEDRGLLLDYDEFAPGPRAYNIDELTQLLNDISNGDFVDQYSDKRSMVLQKIFDPKYHPGSQILVKEIDEALRSGS